MPAVLRTRDHAPMPKPAPASWSELGYRHEDIKAFPHAYLACLTTSSRKANRSLFLPWIAAAGIAAVNHCVEQWRSLAGFLELVSFF